MENRDTQIHLRVTMQEKKQLEERACKRGVTLSAYILQMALEEKNMCIYDVDFRKAVENVCGLYEFMQNIPMDNNHKCKYMRGVEMLWQYLR